MQLAEPEMQLVRLRSRRLRLSGRAAQSLLVGARGFSEATLSDPDVAEHKDAADGGKDMAAQSHAGERAGECAVRILQVSTSPQRERQKRGCARARRVVAVRNEIECALRLLDGRGSIAECLREIDACRGELAGQRPKALLVRDDHLCGGG